MALTGDLLRQAQEAQTLARKRAAEDGIVITQPAGNWTPPEPEPTEGEKLKAIFDRRRAEFAARYPDREIRPDPKEALKPLFHPVEPIKIWPKIMLSAITNKHGGAARLWFYARSLDLQGSGRINREELFENLTYRKVDERQRRRWLAEALDLGIMTQVKGDFYLASLERGALLLRCDRIGNPVDIHLPALFKRGWRAHIWAGYLAGLKEGQPISQEYKQTLTGISPRVQCNYQKQVAGSARKNFAATGLEADHLSGLKEEGRSSAFIGSNGLIFYRLPDLRIVPGFVSSPTHRGRSRKAQKVVNSLLNYPERGSWHFPKLFHASDEGVRLAIEDSRSMDPGNRPREIFRRDFVGRFSNLWRPVPVACEGIAL